MDAIAPQARDAARDAPVTAVLGPTNTGKTHYAIERMLAHRSGVIGFPLRLLAREVYDRVVAIRGPRAAALITGEEKIAPADAQYVICTVESMPLDWGSEFLAVDEIQLCADPERGHVFTDRLLRARGREETLFLGAETMRPRIQALIPKARFLTRPRFSTLSYAGPKKLSRLPPRSAIVAFSVDQVYAIAELLRRQKGGAAVVMGALSPRTRNAQVELYQNGDVEHLVATDAIGMGLNLDLKHVAFAGLAKFDGWRHRALAPQELAQIAGRAGRHMTDGTFGLTGEARALDADAVERIQNHRFDPVGKLQWRNARLEFGTVDALLRSLEAPAPDPNLQRAREADDVAALRLLWADDDIRERARGGAAVRTLWDVCQIPDFRKTHQTEHAQLLSRIYRFLLSDAGAIPADWIDGQVERLDRIDGDIDALSKRLAYVRTWTYVANRGRWLDDPAAWRERTRAVEDRLSDALHERLTQRFVDRRTSVLMKRLKQKERLVAEVNDAGDVTVEGHHLGRLEGFRFRPDPEASADELKTLKAASSQALQAQLSWRADKFYNAPDTEIEVTDQGGLMWGGDAVGRLEPGADALSPQVRAFADEMADPSVAEKVRRRLGHWIERRIKALFEPLIALRDDPAVTGLARGVAYQLVEGLGVLPRRQIAEDVKSLEQEGRSQLRKHGVRFGQHHVFMPALLKPAPTRFRILLWSLKEGFEEFPEPPAPGLVTIPKIEGAPEGFYTRAGYRLAGPRALRIDMLERLADLIRPLDARTGFEATPDMLSITGCTLDQFAELMQGLGYVAERGERAKPQRTAAAGQAAPSDAADVSAQSETPSPTAPTPAAAEEATQALGEDRPPQPPAGAAAPETEARQAEADEVAPAAGPEAAEAEPAEAAGGPAGGEGGGEAAPAAPPAAPTPAAAEAVAEALEADAPPEPPEGSAPPDPEARQAEADAAAPAGQSPEGAPEAARDGEGVETFFTFRLPPRGPRRGPPRGARGEDGGPRSGGRRRAEEVRGSGGRPAGAERPAAARGDETVARPGGRSEKPTRGGRPPQGDFGKGKRKGPPKRDEKPRTFTSGPGEERRAADADNPFAVLKQLKDKL